MVKSSMSTAGVREEFSVIRFDAAVQKKSPTENVAGWPGVVQELRSAMSPAEAFVRLAHLPRCVFFDSAQQSAGVGRYAFIAADPFELLTADPDDATAWRRTAEWMQEFCAPTLPNLPPFQGGAAGVFSYELARSLETLPKARFNEFNFPGMLLGLYDVVVAFDHQTEQSWIISQGFPEVEPTLRKRRARARAEEFARCLAAAVPERIAERKINRLPLVQLAPQFEVPHTPAVTSNFSREQYLTVVERGIEYIRAGDVFQVNLSQRLLAPAKTDSISLYLKLRDCNPAPFAAYFDLGDFQIVSASPERFLQVREREVETRPIKGTRRRANNAESNRGLADELTTSAKDRAENVMIVDLLRNDLSRVCLPDSVVVSELCRLEQFEFVQHLVSVIHGELRPECRPRDLLHAAFPGGSVTGAPKIRAMEIIAELEPTARGAYCGALGYIGFDGTMDSNILIRTITAGRGWWQLSVGGGVVAQSDPGREYQETWEKAEGLLRAI
jgi:para-aminobenzoate synthetase component I